MDTAAPNTPVENLPTPLPVARYIAAVIADPAATERQAAEALRLDPAFAAKMLRLANAAVGGVTRKVASLQNAASVLGMNRLRAFVRMAAMINPASAKKSSPVVLSRFWRHSLTVGLIAESIARHLKRYDAVDEQEIYSAALLHDIGILVLAADDAAGLSASVARGRERVQPFHLAENPEAAHALAGRRIGEQWGFPSELTSVIAGHHGPVPARDQGRDHGRAIAIVHVADVMVQVLGCSVFEGEVVPRISDDALHAIRLPVERLRIIAETELDALKKIEELCAMAGD